MTTEQDKNRKVVDTTFGLTEEQIKVYREAFNQFDKDGNGSITMSELMTVMKSLGYNPSRKALEKIIKEVDMDGFPTVIGCMDGTFMRIIAPMANEQDYVNRKGVHSLNVQMVCDAQFKITNCVAKWPGSSHDSRVFRDNVLCHNFENESGTLDFSEFLTMMVHQMRDEFSHEELKEIFSVIDKDGDGYICAYDLRQTLRNLGFQLSQEDVSVMMSEADVTGEGDISFEDFVTIMLSK